jgi:hypothetical protein
MSRSIVALSAFAVVSLAGVASATPVIYTSQASFNAAVTAPGVDTFNDMPLASAPSPLNRLAGSYGYTGAVTTTTFFTAGTASDVWLSTNTATDSIVFNNFGPSVSAVGGFFFTSDINGSAAAGSITVSIVDASGTYSQTINSSTPLSFLGFVSDSNISSVTVTSVQPSPTAFIWPTVNDLTLAQAVPAPGAAALMGLGGLLVGRRRR